MTEESAKTILIVDDDPSVQTLLAEMLKRMGYQTLLAASGNEALAIAAAETLDLLLLDSRLPDISGLEVFAQLESRGSEIPVIFVTGMIGDDIKALQKEHPKRVSSLAKPFAMQNLHDTVQQLLGG